MVRPYSRRYSNGNESINFATLWVNPIKGVLCMRTPYNRRFIDEFKEKVPKECRRWQPGDKLWQIEVKYLDEVINLCSKYFTIDTLPAEGSNGDSPYHRLIKHLSPDGIKRVWRIVASELHPDKGGSKDKFIEASGAFEEIIKQLGKEA